MATGEAAAAATVLSTVGEQASVWFCMGGTADEPRLVLVDRASDPKGAAFLPQAKELAGMGPVAQGIASRQGGGAFSFVSRNAYPEFLARLVRWAAAGVVEHRDLERLRDARFTQVDASNSVIDKQEDAEAWKALDEAIEAASRKPAREPDPATAASLEALAGGAGSLWCWLPVATGDDPPVMVLVDRAVDPKGATFGATMKAAIEAGTPNAGSARGIFTLSPGQPPTFVSRNAYSDFVPAMLRWLSTWQHLDGASRITGARFNQVDASNTVIDKQEDAAAWESASQAAAAPAKAPAAEGATAQGAPEAPVSEAAQAAALIEKAELQAQHWFWLGRRGESVAFVLRSVDKDPKRVDFEKSADAARVRLEESAPGTTEQVVGRARKMADERFLFQSMQLMSNFTHSLRTWVIENAGTAPALQGLVGSRFNHVSDQGHVFVEQTWPSVVAERPPVPAAGAAQAAPAAPVATPAQAAAPAQPESKSHNLPEAPDLEGAERRLEGVRLDLEVGRATIEKTRATAQDGSPRSIQAFGNAVEALAGQVEGWLETRMALDAARRQTRALRRQAWTGTGSDDAPSLPELSPDPEAAANLARELAAACLDAVDAGKEWMKKASGPPMAAKNPVELPDLRLPDELRRAIEAVFALEKALDDACARTDAPAGSEALDEADTAAAAAAAALDDALLALAADAATGATGLRRTADAMNMHGQLRDRFPPHIRSGFDLRLVEVRTALEQLSDGLLFLTRPA